MTQTMRLLLKNYDSQELTDMLMAMAHTGGAVKDMDALTHVVPELLTRFIHYLLMGQLYSKLLNAMIQRGYF